MTDIRRNRFPSNVSDVVDFNAMFREYSCFVNGNLIPKNKPLSAYIMEQLEINDMQYEEINNKFLINKCNWRALQDNKFFVPVDGFHHDFSLYDIPEDTNLRSLQNLREKFLKPSKQRSKLLKYRGQVYCDYSEGPDKDKVKEILRSYDDYLFTIRVYRPIPHHFSMAKKRSKELLVTQEFIVHSRQKLSALKDRILCEEDYHPAEGDVSLNPFLPTKIRNYNVFRSSMFFIDDKFFIDGRNPGNIDYSEVVKAWAAKKKLHYGITKKMENTSFSSLSLRLGYPYLYMHQGGCEHLIIFTDARLVNPSDVLSKAAYPIMKSFSSVRGVRCSLCAKRIPKFIVINMKNLPSVTVYMCGLCLYLYCYTKDGKKLCDFYVYKYVDRTALL